MSIDAITGSSSAATAAAKAKDQLGWTPRYTSLEALRSTLRP